ncbi:hypothetical protein [Fodinibius sp. Rm-B-1B1-1]|uniref:hypothetical protein n=1 Tax=Fodinibius alkaliphilus TaxID=3140241 RepID=UPI00315A844D
MEILLLGKSSTITATVKTMLQSIDDWIVRSNVEFSPYPQLSTEPYEYDILIANLEDFNTSPIPLIEEISKQYPQTPLLIIYSYRNKELITPILAAGATGYIQQEMSEEDLFKAVNKVSENQEIVIADFT